MSAPSVHPPKGTKVVVAMSGGVDSSVAAALLRREGYEVVGCFMRLGSVEQAEHDAESCDAGTAPSGADGASNRARAALPLAAAHHRGCCSLNDAADARLVAAHLDIPFYAVNFERDFGRVIDYFVDEYEAGRTPNPCVRCNDWLKFGRLHALAKDLGAAFVASGHYARVAEDAAGRPRLLRGVDHGKDQSYVLFGTNPGRLREMLLPIGSFPKLRVRELARELGLPVAEKPDSQEICFVPDGDYAALIERRRPGSTREGAILDESGRTIGTHAGHQHFTVGQRRGVPLATGTPVHVVSKDPAANTITVAARSRLLRRGCTATRANWFEDPSTAWRPCGAKVRSNSPPAPAQVRAAGDGCIEVRFDPPVEAVAPGQAVVCYDDDAVICGGWIESATSD